MFIALLPNNLCAPEERHVPECIRIYFAPNGAKEKKRRDEAINILLLSKEPISKQVTQSGHIGDVNVEPLFGPRSLTACRATTGKKLKPSGNRHQGS